MNLIYIILGKNETIRDAKRVLEERVSCNPKEKLKKEIEELNLEVRQLELMMKVL